MVVQKSFAEPVELIGENQLAGEVHDVRELVRDLDTLSQVE